MLLIVIALKKRNGKDGKFGQVKLSKRLTNLNYFSYFTMLV